MAVEMARSAEANGADGVLLLPPYLTEVGQAGLAAHVREVCRATGLGVVVYHRANARFELDTMLRLVEECPNLIGFKDGIGDIELLATLSAAVGDRLVYIGGLPTAETYALPYLELGVLDLLLGDLQLRARLGTGLLRRGASPRPRARAGRHPGLPHPVPGDPQPEARVRGGDRQGCGAAGGP